MQTRKQIAAANWKMNLTLDEGEKLIADIIGAGINVEEGQEVIFAVPFPYLISINELTNETERFHVAAQNFSAEKNGAYTGEVSASMLKCIGINYVIIGHSERRELYNESNEIIKKKADLALACDLKPIYCCGEPLQIREAETQNAYIENQLNENILHLSAQQIKNFIIAYEPIWAIGTGRTATAAQVQEMHYHIRSVLANKYGIDISNTVSILYGGSVKAANAEEIFSQPDVDGGLVGGASLIATEFVTIIKSLKK